MHMREYRHTVLKSRRLKIPQYIWGPFRQFKCSPTFPAIGYGHTIRIITYMYMHIIFESVTGTYYLYIGKTCTNVGWLKTCIINVSIYIPPTFHQQQPTHLIITFRQISTRDNIITHSIRDCCYTHLYVSVQLD